MRRVGCKVDKGSEEVRSYPTSKVLSVTCPRNFFCFIYVIPPCVIGWPIFASVLCGFFHPSCVFRFPGTRFRDMHIVLLNSSRGRCVSHLKSVSVVLLLPSVYIYGL